VPSSVNDAEVKLPRRAMIRSSIAAVIPFALIASGVLAALLGKTGGVVGLAVGVVVPLLCPAWVVTARPIRLLRSRAAQGSVANIVDAAVIAFGLDATAVSAVVVDTPVLNCGAFPSRRNAIVVWVTTGLVEALDRAQLEAVLFAQVAVASDHRIRRATVNEALMRLSLLPSFALVFLLFFVMIPEGTTYAVAGDEHVFFGLTAALFAGFVICGLFWNREKFTFARIKAADAIAAATTLLPDALTSAFVLISERTTEVRYRITLAALVDPFALTATGTPIKKSVNDKIVASGAGTERGLLATRAEYLRGLLNGSDEKIDITERIYTETAALEGPSYEDGSKWYPDPFYPDAPQLRRYKDGQWFAETKDEKPVLKLWKISPKWMLDPYSYAFGVRRWWDGERYTGHTKPPIIEPGAIAPGSAWPPPAVT
jgi:Zn-dependent protease with chaperone function